MTKRGFLPIAAGVVAACLVGLSFAAAVRSEALPTRLSDQEFWSLASDMSESNGTFRSDNLLSNELWFQHVIPDLTRTVKAGGVYMGVGPEQNFTYIAALKPAMAFIVDIRRGNLDLHLMYKALFEMSPDRAEFVSRLFSKKRPESLDTSSSAAEIFSAYASVDTSDALYAENLKAIKDDLVVKHGFDLSADDLNGIEYVYHAFFRFGPELQYSSTGGFGGGFQPSYADLMIATDENGTARGYLASEERFSVLKDLEGRNMLVPLVGNFGGPKAIRAVGAYLAGKGTTVSAFYLSNVEQYLQQDGLWRTFCGNVATLPLDDASTFIRAVRNGRGGPGIGLNPELGAMAAEVEPCRSPR